MFFSTDNGTTYTNDSLGYVYTPSSGNVTDKTSRKIMHFDSQGRLDKIYNYDEQEMRILYNTGNKISFIDNFICKDTTGKHTVLYQRI